MHWRQLEVWQKAHALALDVYRVSKLFPEEERFRLTNQFCKAAVSVPANIVEGDSRRSTKEYIQFLSTSRGSLEKTRYYALLAKDLGYLEVTQFEKLESQGESVSRMLNALIRALCKRTK
jgi:four helix bundle protein